MSILHTSPVSLELGAGEDDNHRGDQQQSKADPAPGISGPVRNSRASDIPEGVEQAGDIKAAPRAFMQPRIKNGKDNGLEQVLDQKEIDLAIFPIYVFSVDEGKTLIENMAHARYVSPMHYAYQYPPASVEKNFSNAVVFKDTLEKWVVS